MKQLNMKLSIDRVTYDINGAFIDLSEYSIDTINNVYLIDYLPARQSINYHYSIANSKLYLLMPLVSKIDMAKDITILLDFFSIRHEKEINREEFRNKTLDNL